MTQDPSKRIQKITLIYNIMTVPSIMTILMKIITIIIVIVFHDDDFDENHHDHHCDCLSKLSILGPFECLLGRVGGTPSTEHLVQLLAHSDKRRPLAHLLELSSPNVSAS